MELFNLHKQQLKDFFTYNDEEEALKLSYAFMKEIASYYYVNGSMTEEYVKLCDILNSKESIYLGDNNLIVFSHIIDTICRPSKEDVLDYIIWCSRIYLLNECYQDVDMEEDLYWCHFEGMCYFSSKKVQDICKELGIKCHLIRIVPGYNPDIQVPCEIRFHCFNIIEYESKYYLVDLTLAQFFKKKSNHPDRLGVALLEGPSVGAYLSRLKGGKEIAKKLFTDGYIELDEEIFKTYMDSFTLSFRNGIYYEEDGLLLPYSVDDYIKHLKGETSKLGREKVYCLGEQTRPLSKPIMNIFDKLS